jgi:nucleoside-diphosphate kinase
MSTQTFVMIKPDAIKRSMTPNIRKMIEEAGFSIKLSSYIFFSEDKVREFYKEHEGRPFFEDLVDNMKDSIVIGLLVSKPEDCVKSFRELVGNTDPSLAAENTIRGRFGLSKSRNSVHASDSDESAVRELKLMLGLN